MEKRACQAPGVRGAHPGCPPPGLSTKGHLGYALARAARAPWSALGALANAALENTLKGVHVRRIRPSAPVGALVDTLVFAPVGDPVDAPVGERPMRAFVFFGMVCDYLCEKRQRGAPKAW